MPTWRLTEVARAELRSHYSYSSSKEIPSNLSTSGTSFSLMKLSTYLESSSLVKLILKIILYSSFILIYDC